MFNNITNRKASEEEGFTLIELVVVVAILGILTAVAIPVTGGILSWAKSEGYHANNAVNLQTVEVRIQQEGGRVTQAEVGSQAFGQFMGRVMAITADVQSKSDRPIGFVPQAINGELFLCAFTISEDGQYGRTSGPAECNRSGPNMG